MKVDVYNRPECTERGKKVFGLYTRMLLQIDRTSLAACSGCGQFDEDHCILIHTPYLHTYCRYSFGIIPHPVAGNQINLIHDDVYHTKYRISTVDALLTFIEQHTEYISMELIEIIEYLLSNEALKDRFLKSLQESDDLTS